MEREKIKNIAIAVLAALLMAISGYAYYFKQDAANERKLRTTAEKNVQIATDALKKTKETADEYKRILEALTEKIKKDERNALLAQLTPTKGGGVLEIFKKQIKEAYGNCGLNYGNEMTEARKVAIANGYLNPATLEEVRFTKKSVGKVALKLECADPEKGKLVVNEYLKDDSDEFPQEPAAKDVIQAYKYVYRPRQLAKSPPEKTERIITQESISKATATETAETGESKPEHASESETEINLEPAIEETSQDAINGTSNEELGIAPGTEIIYEGKKITLTPELYEKLFGPGGK